MSELAVLARIAVRNIFASFLNLVIGGIILVGTLLFVVGGSLLSSVDVAMSRSITGSIAGNAQLYSDHSKDELSLFNNWTEPDITPIPDFSKVKPSVTSVANVKTVIPMGVNGASVMYGNTVDLALEKLRKAVDARKPAPEAERQSLIAHVRRMVQVIQGDYLKLADIASKQAIDPEAVKDLEKAASEVFWHTFEDDPLAHLEFLENRIASLVPDADFIYFSYVGTDLDAFKQSFDRMQIVDGQMVPPGQRGLLMSKYVYEKEFKMKSAHRLDKIREALEDEGKKIEKDPDLQLMIKQNRTQTREFLLQLDPLAATDVGKALRAFLGSKEMELPKLLTEFFDMNDLNFRTRYDFFYRELAPRVELYRLRPGDQLPIKAFTKSGFIQSVSVKVYGTFQFKGLEKSGLAGGMSLMDLMTFRDLYGYITPEKLAESKRLQESSGTKFVARDRAEADLFGEDSSVVNTTESKKIDDQAELGGIKYDATSRELQNRSYTPEEIEKGVILNAAIILKDPTQLDATIKEISAKTKADGLDLRIVSWQKAAGSLGQFVFVAKAVLYFAVFIIFIVALVIINNAVMMATLQRIQEIGTMRAIGAQRGFILLLVLLETLLLGLVFGSVGTFLGSLVVRWMGSKGLPAGNEFLYFFFSGPRLYPSLSVGSLVGAFVIIIVVTSISALYPALLATRVSPLRAMQAEN